MEKRLIRYIKLHVIIPKYDYLNRIILVGSTCKPDKTEIRSCLFLHEKLISQMVF